MLSLLALTGTAATILWIIAAILVIWGIVTLIRGGVLAGIVLIIAVLRSLDPEGDEITEREWAEAWEAELHRRVDAFERGEAEPSDWRESLARVRRSLQEGRSQ